MRRFCVALACAVVAVRAAAGPIDVTFPSLDRDARGAAIVLQGVLLLPRHAAPPGGFPAIIALHGCGGMFSTRDGHAGELAERMALRADPYRRDGYAVLFADSFRSRGGREICTVRRGEPTTFMAFASGAVANRIAVPGGSVTGCVWSRPDVSV